MRRLHLMPMAASAVLVAATLAACGGSSEGSSSDDSGGGTVGAAAELVTDDLKGSEVSAVVMNDYPPSGFVEGGKIVGLNPDLLHAIADDTGLDIKVDGSSWDAMIPGLQADRWQIMHASAIITPERLAMFDFISTDKNYTAFVTSDSSDLAIENEADVCGRTFSVVKGSIDGDTVTDINSSTCEPAGEEPATLQTFAGNDAALLAVSSGRVDAAVMAGATVPDLIENSGGKFVEQPLEGAPTFGGIAVAKGSELGPILEQAVKDLIESGVYEKIYATYNSTNSMVDEPELMTG